MIMVFTVKKPDLDSGNWLEQSNAIRELLVGIICLIISILFFLICIFGCFAVCARWCWCLFLLTPLTLAAAFFLFAIGSIHDNLDTLIERVCEEAEEDIKHLWSDVIDVPMCSDLCPCSQTEFEQGLYHSMTAE